MIELQNLVMVELNSSAVSLSNDASLMKMMSRVFKILSPNDGSKIFLRSVVHSTGVVHCLAEEFSRNPFILI